MQDLDHNTRDVGQEAGEDLKRSAERLSDDARNAAESVGTRAREEATHQADRAKSGVASELSGIARALNSAAAELRHGSPQERAFEQVAGSLSGVSDAIRDRDLADLAADVSAFARRNPLGFLGGAALAGFAATRFAKASGAPRPGADAPYNAPSGQVTTSAPTSAPATAPETRPDDVMAPAVIPATYLTPGEH
ncbi:MULTISPECIES: ATP synthase subunit B family protein [Actibacterium]|uniref:Uncharacterized protein n=1 Tax=Actibacterium naphthalenivorans TaxID=1614693 RepID=A0A840CKH0_9RHOB|nr:MULTISPECIES: hypothetical protein [Actibacterium]MBB4024008.1 hypothetical protein [Actibacterium naphthalenivorans]